MCAKNGPPDKHKDPAEAVLIKHSQFKELYDELEECFDSYGTTADPLCKAIVGPSGAGKSTVAEYFADQHGPIRHASGDEFPCLVVRVPTEVAPRSLAEAFLIEFDDPYPSRGSLGLLTQRVDRALGNGKHSHGVHLVVLNEIQHFIDSKYGFPYKAADWIKDRIEKSGVPFVILGLEYGLDLLRLNDQLQRLFPETIEVKHFDWGNEKDRNDFRGVLRQIRADLADSYDFPEMHKLDLACRLHYASFGLIGYLMKIVRGAARLARKAKTKQVSTDMLALAYEKEVREKDPRCPNPISAPQFDLATAPPLVPPSDKAAERRMNWRERTGNSRMPLRRDRKSPL